jgi:hypothetical protein
MCKDPFQEKSQLYGKVRDHDHISGRYIGAAHGICNLNRREVPVMKILAHNFSGYDSHLIIENLDVEGVVDVNVIPKSGEKFMAVTINQFYTLCDSMSFLTGSLDTLARTLPPTHPYFLLRQSTLMAKQGEAKLPSILQKWKFRKFIIIIIILFNL